MLEKDPEKRISIEEIKEHPWMSLPIPTYEEIKEEIMPFLSSSSQELAEKISKKHQRKHQMKKQCLESSQKRHFSPSAIIEEYQIQVESLNNKLKSLTNIEKPSSEKRNSDAALYQTENFSQRKVSKDDMDVNYYSQIKNCSSSSSDSDSKDCD